MAAVLTNLVNIDIVDILRALDQGGQERLAFPIALGLLTQSKVLRHTVRVKGARRDPGRAVGHAGVILQNGAVEEGEGNPCDRNGYDQHQPCDQEHDLGAQRRAAGRILLRCQRDARSGEGILQALRQQAEDENDNEQGEKLIRQIERKIRGHLRQHGREALSQQPLGEGAAGEDRAVQIPAEDRTDPAADEGKTEQKQQHFRETAQAVARNEEGCCQRQQNIDRNIVHGAWIPEHFQNVGEKARNHTGNDTADGRGQNRPDAVKIQGETHAGCAEGSEHVDRYANQAQQYAVQPFPAR